MTSQLTTQPDTQSDKIIYKSEVDVVLAIRDYYSDGGHVVMPQVRNAAGFEANRTADALVMSTWPSRGLNLFGVEIKVSRADFLKELKDPAKAESVARYCDYWILALGDESIAKIEEVPVGWGVMVPAKTGRMRMKRHPQQLNPCPIDRSFLACIMKGMVDSASPFTATERELARRVKLETDKIETALTERITKTLDVGRLAERNRKLEAAAQAFYEATGSYLSADDVESYRAIGEVLVFLRYESLSDKIAAAKKDLELLVDGIGKIESALIREVG